MKEKIEIKEIEKHLPLSSKIKIRIKKNNAFKISQKAIEKIKYHFISQKAQIDYMINDKKTTFNEFIADEKSIAEEKAIQKRNAEREEIKKIHEEINILYPDGKYLNFSDKVFKKYTEQIYKISQKKIWVEKKGLGIFSLSKIAIGKLIKNAKAIKDEKNENERKLYESLSNAKQKSELLNKYRDVLNQIKTYKEKTGIDLIKKLGNPELNSEPIEVTNVRKPRDKATLKRKIAVVGIVAILALTLNNHHLNNQTTQDIIPITKPIQHEETLAIKSNLELGSVVKINTESPLYESAIDADRKTNPQNHYFKDDDNRIIESLNYKLVENGIPKYFNIWINDNTAAIKINELENRGATLESVLVTKQNLINGKTHEGFKNIEDIQSIEKRISR